MANWNNPVNSDNYAGVLPTLNAKIASSAKMDFTGDTNMPNGTLRLNQGTNTFESWNGASWDPIGYMDGLWQTWSPIYSASGSMTYTSVTTNVAKYRKQGNYVEFFIYAIGTIGGTLDNGLRFTLPVAHVDGLPTGCMVYDGGSTSVAGFILPISSTVAEVYKYNSSNYTAGGSRYFRINGRYESV